MVVSGGRNGWLYLSWKKHFSVLLKFSWSCFCNRYIYIYFKIHFFFQLPISFHPLLQTLHERPRTLPCSLLLAHFHLDSIITPLDWKCSPPTPGDQCGHHSRANGFSSPFSPVDNLLWIISHPFPWLKFETVTLSSDFPFLCFPIW